jgi:hypothetical protein
MDCHDARLLLTLQRREPDQLDRVELEAIERHIELCPGCQSWNQSEAKFESALTTAIKNVPLPAGLKERIASGLARSPRPRGKAWAAATVAALLAVAAVGVYFWTQPTTVYFADLPSVRVEEEQDSQAVQNYFKELGHSMTPPPEFDYQNLREYKLVRFKGKSVPRLTFQCRGDRGLVTAHVYCLPSRQFRFDSDLEEIVATSGQYEIVHGNAEVYLIACSGDVWQLKRRPAG